MCLYFLRLPYGYKICFNILILTDSMMPKLLHTNHVLAKRFLIIALPLGGLLSILSIFLPASCFPDHIRYLIKSICYTQFYLRLSILFLLILIILLIVTTWSYLDFKKLSKHYHKRKEYYKHNK